jgi:hypothetical protein
MEMPPDGMDAYVAVSENIQKKYNIPNLIKNPIDTDLYMPCDAINGTPERFLDVTGGNVPYDCIKPSRSQELMPKLMNEVDVVFTIGRGVLEAMSCGRNVIVYDERDNMGFKADGYLTLPITGNVGGEYKLDSIDFEKELAKYNPKHGERNRKYILKYHDVRKIVDQYLALWMTIKKDT